MNISLIRKLNQSGAPQPILDLALTELEAEQEKLRAGWRERQARKRERDRLALLGVTVSHRDMGSPYNTSHTSLRSYERREEVRSKRERTELPSSWRPSEDAIAWAASVGRNEGFVKWKAKQFRDYIDDQEEPVLSSNWDRKFQNYLRIGHNLTPPSWYRLRVEEPMEEGATGLEPVKAPAPDSELRELVEPSQAPEVQTDPESPPTSPVGDPTGVLEVRETGKVIPFPGRKPDSQPEPEAKVVPLKSPEPSKRDAEDVNYDPVSREQAIHPTMKERERPAPDEAEKARIDAATRMLKQEIKGKALPIDKSAALPFVKGEGAKPPEPIKERPPMPETPKNPLTVYHPDPMLRRIMPELDADDHFLRETFGATQAQIDEGRRLLKGYQEAMATLAERRAKWWEEWGR